MDFSLSYFLRRFFNFIAIGRNGFGVIAFNKLNFDGSNKPLDNHPLINKSSGYSMYLFGKSSLAIKSDRTKIRFPVWQTSVYPLLIPTFNVEEKEFPCVLSLCLQWMPGGTLELISIITTLGR